METLSDHATWFLSCPLSSWKQGIPPGWVMTAGTCSRSELVTRMAIWGQLFKKRGFFWFFVIHFFTNCKNSRTSTDDLTAPIRWLPGRCSKKKRFMISSSIFCNSLSLHLVSRRRGEQLRSMERPPDAVSATPTPLAGNSIGQRPPAHDFVLSGKF